MHQLALKVVKTRNIRPLPIIQGTCCLYHNITLIAKHGSAVDIFDL